MICEYVTCFDCDCMWFKNLASVLAGYLLFLATGWLGFNVIGMTSDIL